MVMLAVYKHHHASTKLAEKLLQSCSLATESTRLAFPKNETVQRLAVQHGLDMRLIPMKNTHHAEKMELLIGRNLDWVQQAQLQT
jgi:DNA adenine methylase